MEQNRQELSDLVQNDRSFTPAVGDALKKTGKFLYQTIIQSPDADILFVGYVASYFVPEMENMHLVLGAFAAKQYLWGHWSYNIAKKQLNKTRNFSEKAFARAFSPWRTGPCYYFGSRYALREYKRQMAENARPLTD